MRALTFLALCSGVLSAVACQRAPAPADEPPADASGRDDPGRVRIPLASLGLRDAQRFNTQPTLSFPFFSRSDRVLTAASLTLRFNDLDEDVRGLDVLVNQDKFASLTPDAMRGRREVRIPIDAAVIGDKNLLTLRLSTRRSDPCGRVPVESWKLLDSGELEMQSAPLPLPDDLSILPLPFVDRHFDREASVTVVLPKDPSSRMLRAASRLAGWFGVDGGIPLRFHVSLGALPEGSAVVLIDDAAQATALGLAAPTGALLQLMDHPKVAVGNVKLLLLAGRTPDELDLAVDTLAAGSAGRFPGPRFMPKDPVARAPALPDAAPRWLPQGRPVRLDELGTTLAHDGPEGGKIAANFRLPPDLWVWPDEFVALDLKWQLTLPADLPPPRLDVIFNGAYLGQLRDLDVARGEIRGLQRLRIHRSKLKGFNALSVFVNYAAADRICGAGSRGKARVELLGDSELHVESYGLFAPQPDLEEFVDDGFPFTRLADLSETAAVLSTPLRPDELAMLLSLSAHFASITGVPGAPSFPTAAEALEPGFDKDLLVFSDVLLKRWSDRLPLLTGETPRVQLPAQADPVLSLFSGRRGEQELQRARGVLAPLPSLAALSAFESPSHPGRTAVALTSTGELGSIAEFVGNAEGSFGRGDLLVSSGGRRYRFAIGPEFARGRLDRWNGLRWFLAQHPLLLVPFVLAGVLVLALILRVRLERRVQQRLSPELT